MIVAGYFINVLFITTHVCISVLFSGSDSSKLMKVVIYIYK